MRSVLFGREEEIVEKYCLALLLDKDVSARVVQLSEAIGRVAQSRLTLSSSALPHVTLAQFEASETVARAAWRSTRWRRGRLRLDFAGVTLLPSHRGGTWIEIQVLKSRAIGELQSYLLSRRPLRGLRPLNSVGDEFRPHVTVAYVDSLPERLPPLPVDVLRASSVSATLCLGLVSDHYALSQVLERAR